MRWPWQKWKPELSGIVSGAALKQNLRRIYPDAQVITLDRGYQIPADPADVTWQCSPIDLMYKKEYRDCDDFVRMARGWLSREKHGSLLVMDCVIDYPGGRHALLAFLDGDKIVFGEPQTGKMRTFDEVKIIRLIA